MPCFHTHWLVALAASAVELKETVVGLGNIVFPDSRDATIRNKE
jgi:hypothetical protein